MNSSIDRDPEFKALLALSASLGRDPLRTQAAGGNTSFKRDGVMWVKASGRWLADALDEDIMVPIDLAAMRDALARNDSSADDVARFVDQARNPGHLRPSIETSVHACLPHAVVVHIHCVDTIALAVRADAEAAVAERLRGSGGIEWSLVPYRRPGLPLAKAIGATMKSGANVLVLANHGLVVAGQSVSEVAERLDRVCRAFAAKPRNAPRADLTKLEKAVEGSAYRLPTSARAHAVALDEASRSIVRGGSLYPDHVIFLGAGVVEAREGALGAAFDSEGGRDGQAPMLLLPRLGVVLHRSTNKSADAMAQCLADVAARIEPGAVIQRLSSAQEYELSHWEAEKYRQTLGVRSAAP
jgi:rhamnose utilization protein RhaD (predicted bifunctional aldolase and dehydrogenase)